MNPLRLLQGWLSGSDGAQEPERVQYAALPYTIVMTLVGLLCVEFTLMPVTQWMLDHQWIVTPLLP